MIELLKKELVEISRRLDEKNYVQAAGGNISVRVPGKELLLIKRTGVTMAGCSIGDILVVDFDGRVVEGWGKPSKEINFHAGILKSRGDIGAVVHTHSNYAVAISNLGAELPMASETALMYLKHVPLVKRAVPGSEQLAQNVITVFAEDKSKNIKAVLMEAHGVCATGATLQEAYEIADLVEGTAHQAYIQATAAPFADFICSYNKEP
ncbi:MAG: class II aldolase/adducin family protein [Angelakisella sp.]|nr:class II aldolase/adducin family protein [Angelakisella sp.]